MALAETYRSPSDTLATNRFDIEHIRPCGIPCPRPWWTECPWRCMVSNTAAPSSIYGPCFHRDPLPPRAVSIVSPPVLDKAHAILLLVVSRVARHRRDDYDRWLIELPSATFIAIAMLKYTSRHGSKIGEWKALPLRETAPKVYTMAISPTQWPSTAAGARLRTAATNRMRHLEHRD